MIKPTLAVLTIVAIAAMMGAASVAPVYAASMVVTESDVSDKLTGERICGERNVDVDRRIIKKSIILDNDKYEIHVKQTKKYFIHGTDELIAQLISIIDEQGTLDDSSRSFQDNALIICFNGGEGSVDHIGVTLHKDGSITNH